MSSEEQNGQHDLNSETATTQPGNPQASFDAGKRVGDVRNRRLAELHAKLPNQSSEAAILDYLERLSASGSTLVEFAEQSKGLLASNQPADPAWIDQLISTARTIRFPFLPIIKDDLSFLVKWLYRQRRASEPGARNTSARQTNPTVMQTASARPDNSGQQS